MNRPDFGELVKALRLEQHKPDGRKWTRQDLSVRSSLSVKTIENIEYCSKKFIPNIELNQLANAFFLSPQEKLEFFNAYLPPLIIGKTIQEVFLENIQPSIIKNIFPWIVFNQYFDIIAFNSQCASLFGVQLVSALDSLRVRRKKPNVLTVLLWNKDILNHLGENLWIEQLQFTLNRFRIFSLRYRGTNKYHNLIASLSKFPVFRDLWARWSFSP